MRSPEIERVLHMIGVRNIRPSTEGYSCSCPYHEDRHASFAISARKGVFVCYAAKCGASGPTWTLLRDFLGYSRARAEEEIGFVVEVFNLEAMEAEKPKPFHPAIMGVYKSRCPEYLLQRGFKKSVLREWEIGYDRLTQTAVIPVRDHLGELVGLAKRDTTGESASKYVHLYYQKGDLLFGEHRVQKNADHLYVTEGTLSPIKAFQAGLLNVTATSGARITMKQLKRMTEYPSVTLIFDNDQDGRIATEKAVLHLLPRLGSRNVWVCDRFTEGLKDLDEEIDSGNLQRLLQSSQLAEDWLFKMSRMGRITRSAVR